MENNNNQNNNKYHVIFHIDMNCFFASCEIAENPELKGLKIAVAHDSLDKKGIVLTASYEAKRLGVRTPMPLYEAFKVCPDLQIVEPHYELYEMYSSYFFKYLRELTPLVEPASIDEGYVDVTGLCPDLDYEGLAKKIQNDLLEMYNLPCSIGIAPNKFLAKMASDMKKPLGITVLRKRDIEKLMYPLPIEDFFGAGKKTCQALRPLGIKTIGDLARMDKEILLKLFGPNTAEYLMYHVQGNGSTVVDPNSFGDNQSISHAHTLDHNEFNFQNILVETKILCQAVASRLDDNDYVASLFSLTLKYDDFHTECKSITVQNSTSNAYEIIHYITGLLEGMFTGEHAVRLISVGASKFVKKQEEEYRQLSLFDKLDDEEKDYQVDKVINQINDFVGDKILVKGIKNKNLK